MKSKKCSICTHHEVENRGRYYGAIHHSFDVEYWINMKRLYIRQYGSVKTTQAVGWICPSCHYIILDNDLNLGKYEIKSNEKRIR